MLVPYRYNGPGSDQAQEVRLLQIQHHSISIKQDQKASGSCRALREEARIEWPQDDSDDDERDQRAGKPGQPEALPGLRKGLHNVGYVVWQSSFILAELLLRHPPFGTWPDVSVVDLGTGTGTVGIALALAGADVTLTDLPHITPLTKENVDINCDVCRHRARVKDLVWGQPVEALAVRPDLITAADVLYDEAYHADLLESIEQLSSPHTLTYISYRKRSIVEEGFRELAAAAGYAVEEVGTEHLHTEFRNGSYAVLRLCKLG